MNRLNHKTTQAIHLHPGEVYCSADNIIVNTLLGSCVAVCLWDERNEIGGLNHIMLPICRKEDAPSTKFGNVGTFVLYDLMLEKGALSKHIRARVFGGARGIGSSGIYTGLAVGDRNLEVTKAVLRKLGIPIISEDVGGSLGRKISFNLETGKILMKYLRNYNFLKEQKKTIEGNRRDVIW